MREILFRGKQKDNDEWIYGYYHRLTDTLANRVEHCILQEHRHTSTVVDFESVGQFTGLTDKNGKKIFEGDIIQSEYGLSGVIKFGKYHDSNDDWEENFMLGFYVEFKLPSEGIQRLSILTGGNSLDMIKIIGNKYDNPELLKGGAK